MRRRALAALGGLLLAACAAGAPAAHAGTVTFALSDGRLTLTGSASADDVQIATNVNSGKVVLSELRTDDEATTFEATDRASGDACPLPEGRSTEPTRNCDPALIQSVVINLAEGDDLLGLGTAPDAAARGAAIALATDGGPGNDTLAALTEARGGCWALGMRLQGGDGADRIAGCTGDDVLDGGPGADDLSGGGGRDEATYAAATAGVAVDTDDVADDGIAGEGDNVRSDVEVLRGGAGPDTLVGGEILIGGAGDDLLDGGAGPDRLDGGDGSDRLLGGPGGPGDGDLLSGGAGTDSLSYADRTSAVVVTLNDVADDGATGEADDARMDVEALALGASADVVDLSSAGTVARVVQSGNGDDRVTGGPGNDALSGGGGRDRVLGAGGNDAVHGGSADDTVDGGAGNDRVYGESGVDALKGADGDDVLFSADTVKDAVDCGAGNDQVFADATDQPDASCERVDAQTGTSTRAATTGTRGNFTDGDGLFGPDGDGFGDADGDGAGWLSDGGDFAEFSFEDFGDIFDDEFLGFDDIAGFDDDAFFETDEEGRVRSSGRPRIRTKRARLDGRRRVTIAIVCPKKATRRCIGELSLRQVSGKRRTIARHTFAVARGKTARVRLRLTARVAATLPRTGRGKRLGVLVEARDGGEQLWRLSADIRLHRSLKQPKRKARS